MTQVTDIKKLVGCVIANSDDQPCEVKKITPEDKEQLNAWYDFMKLPRRRSDYVLYLWNLKWRRDNWLRVWVRDDGTIMHRHPVNDDQPLRVLYRKDLTQTGLFNNW